MNTTYNQQGQTIQGDQYNVAGSLTITYKMAPPQPIDAATLAEAEARLAALPTDRLAGLAPLPAGSVMPLHRNKLFVGREADLLALAEALKGGQTAAIGQIAAATGLGGIGKTQLASEFVHRYGRYFAGGVYWLSFAEPAAIPTAIVNCGLGMHLRADFATLDIDSQVRLVASAWQSHLPRLLIFDNCDGKDEVAPEELLAAWRPTSGGSRVLVTSRQARWPEGLGVENLALGVLSRAESVELLGKFWPELVDSPPDPPQGGATKPSPPVGGTEGGLSPTDPTPRRATTSPPAGSPPEPAEGGTEGGLPALAAELGDLPLALHLAGSFMKETRTGPEALLAELRSEPILAHEALTGVDTTWSPTNHELHVAKTFALSYERLKPADPLDALARDLLARAACFAPGEPLPAGLLLASVAPADADPKAERQARRGLKRLVNLGLLEEEAETVRLHRLLAGFVRGLSLDEAAQAAVKKVLLDEMNRYRDQANFFQPAPLLPLLPHLQAVAGIGREDEAMARLCGYLGFFLKQIAAYDLARPYYDRALRIREQVLGADHPTTAGSLNNLGALLDSQGDTAAARPYYERALRIREQVLGPEHPDIATSLNNLGGLLRSQGEYGAARPYYERALAIYEQVLGPEHPDTASSLNNLGALLDSQGDTAAARPYLERALHIREQVLGPDHPDTANSLNNLGMLLQSQGEYAAARPYLERALQIWEKVLGPDHPHTAQSLNNLAILSYDQQDLPEARRLMQQALAIWEKRLGPDHPDTQRSRQSLAVIEEALAAPGPPHSDPEAEA